MSHPLLPAIALASAALAATPAPSGAPGIAACGDPGLPPEPLLAVRSGTDVGLWWTPEPTAWAYDVYRVDDPVQLLDLAAEPIHQSAGGPVPAFPVLDPNAVTATPSLLFYQVLARCGTAPCVPGSDRDGDRLDDCVETGTGVFSGLADTGTDPADPDTDGDAIADGDEVLGTAGGLDLPALGASPLRQDVFIEYDWFDDAVGCAAHSHRPTAAVADRVSAAFAAAPVGNPDGSTGIAVHHDYGQGVPFTGGNRIDDADGVLDFGVNNAEFRAYKLAHFAAARNGYFHYVILPHRYNHDSDSSGQAEIRGDDLIVSLYCSATTRNVANTIVHEIGHNFGLLHGGDTSCNDKPNYNSVMNYRFQFPGIDLDCDAEGDGLLDYSRGDRIDLDENDLDERLGSCGTAPISWDGDRRIETGIAFDLNGGNNGYCGGTLTLLTDHDDWAALYFGGIADADLVPREIVDCDNVPPPETGAGER